MKLGHTYAYISSWTTTYGGSEGGGITCFKVDKEINMFLKISHIADGSNASYICVSPDNRYLYMINETKTNSANTGIGGSISAFTIEPETGNLELINVKPTMGVYPCDFGIDKTGKYVFIANQGSRDRVVTTIKDHDGYKIIEQRDEASIVLMPILENGSVGDVCNLIIHKGSSIVPLWQDSAYPHSVNADPSNRFVIVCERGGDKVVVYRFNQQEESKLIFSDDITVTPGYGPRNVCFHPKLPYFYMTNELEPYVNSFYLDQETGKLKQIQCITTVPEDYAPADPNDFFSCTHPSDIKINPNGKFLYVCNRGHNSIALFEICSESGKLKFINSIPSQGENPRDLIFDDKGEKLYVVNTDTGCVDWFSVDSDNGMLVPKGNVVCLERPVCIRFAKV